MVTSLHEGPVENANAQFVDDHTRRPSVDVDFFDPEGTASLRRALSRDSALKDGTRQDYGVVPFDFRRILEDFTERRDTANITSRELGVMFQDLRVVGQGATADPRDDIESSRMAQELPYSERFWRCRETWGDVFGPWETWFGLHNVSEDPCEPAARTKSSNIIAATSFSVPSLTVEQTIMFAARTRAPHQRLGQSCDKYVEVTTDILTTLFGLKHARKTRVGDALIRGVSSGEKKRVSICEALATRACVVAWDNSTRGLDASTALEFIKALRIAIDISKLTTVVSLYQAGESLYRLFDKVCVIYEGKMAYYGPASEARSYFIDMGYEPANRQTTADFLVAVTDPNARIPRSNALSLPRSAAYFVAHFQNSKMGAANQIEIREFRDN